ncbi:unnamed protein product [Anisakis simplex]|uniref:Lipase_3 domain-containing protein n=1 Tax=Anisakis simplex TaxID=6269 RepID=A0A0M3K6B7_ANISI|nr:unnamed protein product [Anisakis simplex]
MEHSSVLLFSVTVTLLISAVCAVHLHLTKYNEAEAKVLVNLAAAAYSNMPETCVNNTLPSDDHWYMVNEANTVCDTHESSCAGYTLRSDKLRQIIVVFRGTKTKKQLLLEGWKSLKPGHDFFGVNRYFFHALDAIWPNVLPTLKDPNFKSYGVTFTGHSLGGALAALAAIRTVLEDLRRSDEIKLITFGEPRVGDKSFSNKFDELVPYSFRVVHRADIVPHLPACRKGEDETPDDDDDSRPCLGDGLGKAYHHGTEI